MTSVYVLTRIKEQPEWATKVFTVGKEYPVHKIVTQDNGSKILYFYNDIGRESYFLHGHYWRSMYWKLSKEPTDSLESLFNG